MTNMAACRKPKMKNKKPSFCGCVPKILQTAAITLFVMYNSIHEKETWGRVFSVPLRDAFLNFFERQLVNLWLKYKL